MWTSFAPLNIATGAGTTLTIVALIADVGRDHVATATSCMSPTVLVNTTFPLMSSVIPVPNDWSGPRSQSIRCTHASDLGQRARCSNNRRRCRGGMTLAPITLLSKADTVRSSLRSVSLQHLYGISHPSSKRQLRYRIRKRCTLCF